MTGVINDIGYTNTKRNQDSMTGVINDIGYINTEGTRTT
jgi:hypothetical protein